VSHRTANRSVAATGVVLVVAALLWATLLPVLLFVVPSYEHAFRSQNRSLPAPTRWTLAAGHWADKYWYVLPLFGLWILPLIILASWLLRHRVTGAWPGWLWLGLLLGLPLLAELAIWTALLLP
jgi:type II secretory pathway component PulF